MSDNITLLVDASIVILLLVIGAMIIKRFYQENFAVKKSKNGKKKKAKKAKKVKKTKTDADKILEMRPIGWFDPKKFNVNTGIWENKVPNGTPVYTSNCNKAYDGTHVYGTTNSTIWNVPWPSYSDYTFIHIAKYNGGSRGRIWNGIGSNWLSGFWGNSVSFYHEGWFDNNIGVSNGGNDWLLTVDRRNHVRVNRGQYQKYGPNHSPQSVGVNRNYEYSDFAISEFLIFDRILSDQEYEFIENYLTKKYNLPFYRS